MQCFFLTRPNRINFIEMPVILTICCLSFSARAENEGINESFQHIYHYQIAQLQTLDFQQNLADILATSSRIRYVENFNPLLTERAISQDEVEEYNGNAAAILTNKKECVIVATHRDDSTIKKGLAAFYDALSLDGLLSNNDIFWLIYAHQLAHCAQYLYSHGNHQRIGKMMLKIALGGQPADSLQQAFADGLQENVADVFAVLKLQQSYIRQNAQDITSGLLPQLSPSAVLLVEYRKEREASGKPITSEPMAQVLIGVLRQPVILEMASDRDIFITAMRLTAARLKAVGQVAGLEPDVAGKLHYPQGYLAMGSSSLLENHILANKPLNNAYKKFHQKYAEPLKTYVHWLRCCQHWS